MYHLTCCCHPYSGKQCSKYLNPGILGSAVLAPPLHDVVMASQSLCLILQPGEAQCPSKASPKTLSDLMRWALRNPEI